MTLLRLVFVAALAVALWRPDPARAEVGAYLLFDMADGTVLAQYEATAVWYPADHDGLDRALLPTSGRDLGQMVLRQRRVCSEDILWRDRDRLL